MPEPDSTLVSIEDARRAEPAVKEPDRLALQELQNSHQQWMSRNQRGWFGRVFGSGLEKPGNAAFLVVSFSFGIVAYALVRLDLSKEHEIFQKILTTMLGPVGLALGYLFGSKKAD